jgi:hypothetical protein
MRRQGKWQGRQLVREYKPVKFTTIIAAIAFIFVLLLVFSSILPAQDPILKLRDWAKSVNLAVGKPIENANTAKALKALDRVPGLNATIKNYNSRFGNDSVYAAKFVDREPDEKNIDDPIVRDNYNIVVISDSAKQITRWWTFLVKKDFREVKYYDQKKAKTADINDWKKQWPATEFLTSR